MCVCVCVCVCMFICACVRACMYTHACGVCVCVCKLGRSTRFFVPSKLYRCVPILCLATSHFARCNRKRQCFLFLFFDFLVVLMRCLGMQLNNVASQRVLGLGLFSQKIHRPTSGLFCVLQSLLQLIFFRSRSLSVT